MKKLAILGLFIALALLPIGCSTGPLTVADLQKKAAEDSKAIELNPNDAAAYRKRADDREKWDTDGAMADYNKTIELNPNDVLAYNGRGWCKKQKGDVDGAMTDYDMAIDLDPKDPTAYFNRDLLEHSIGDEVGRLADDTKLNELCPGYIIGMQTIPPSQEYLFAGALTERGIKKAGNGDYDGAIHEFKMSIQVKPYKAAYFNLGLAKKAKGDMDGAIAAYTKAIELEPENNIKYVKSIASDFETDNYIIYAARSAAKQAKGDIDGAKADLAKSDELKSSAH